MDIKQFGNFLLYSGIITMLISVIYMIGNISNADNFITTWAISMSVGVFSSLWGGIFLFIKKRQRSSN